MGRVIIDTFGNTTPFGLTFRQAQARVRKADRSLRNPAPVHGIFGQLARTF
jgi:hypothetical protein